MSYRTRTSIRSFRLLGTLLFLSWMFLHWGCGGLGQVPCNGASACPEDTVCDTERSLCTCQNNAQRTCYTGASSTQGVGECKSGMQLCSKGDWQECLNQVLPSKEVCGDGKDNDCNGVVDDGCTTSCKDGDTRSCYTGPPTTLQKGMCRSGKQLCQSGRWGACTNEQLPQKEVCDDGKDNDCDGKVDEGCSSECVDGATRACYSGAPNTKDVGSCRAGKQTCSAGQWGACQGEILPQKDVCEDNKDNDCDGQVDEDCIANCKLPPKEYYKITPRPMYTGAPRSGYVVTLNQANAIFTKAPQVTVDSNPVQNVFFDPKQPTRFEFVVISLKSTLDVEIIGYIRFNNTNPTCEVRHSAKVPFCEVSPGGCNNKCKEDIDCLQSMKQFCGNGYCQSSPCNKPKVYCGPTCVDLTSDPQHCGKCDNPCPGGIPCTNGKCANP